MNTEHAQEAVGQVELMFGKEFFGKARAQLIRDLTEEETENVIAAIQILEDQHDFLPTPVKFIRLVRECGAARADKQQDKKVEELRRERQDFNPDKVGFKVFQAMNRLFFSGKATRREILEKIKEADNLKPGVGWAKCGADLQRMYRNMGMDMDKPPGGAIGREL